MSRHHSIYYLLCIITNLTVNRAASTAGLGSEVMDSD